jgi:hypothetical protein
MNENTKIIGDRVFSFATLPAIEAVKVQINIARVIGEPLFKALVESKKPESENMGIESISAVALGLLLSKIEIESLLSTLESVFKYVRVDDKRIDINKNFS